MTKFNRLTLVNSVLLLTIVIALLLNYFNNKQESIVYVDNIKLFNGFNMTKDVKAIEESKIKVLTKTLDSLYLKLNTLTEQQTPTKKRLQQQIAKKSKILQELQDNYTQNLSVNVWKRLNTYIETYAKDKDYTIVLGTSGRGNVMYAKTSIDITTNILEYSNKKYEGH